MDLKKIPLVLLAAVLSAAVYAKDVFIVKNGKNLAAIEYSSKESN